MITNCCWWYIYVTVPSERYMGYEYTKYLPLQVLHFSIYIPVKGASTSNFFSVVLPQRCSGYYSLFLSSATFFPIKSWISAGFITPSRRLLYIGFRQWEWVFRISCTAVILGSLSSGDRKRPTSLSSKGGNFFVLLAQWPVAS